MTVPPDVKRAQARASDPTISAFVGANAGAGKTHVLVQRVIRLMLAGVAPDKILCITFTKAAAANMAERVFTRLGDWVSLDDTALTHELRESGVARVDARTLTRARELFAEALETPGGLKVQTIHALCTRLLQQFPFEANVAARFAVLDDRDQSELMERATLGVLLDAAKYPDSKTGRALTYVMTHVADVTFRDVVQEACLSRDRMLAWITQAGGVKGARAQLSQALGISDKDDADTIARAIVEGPNLPSTTWAETAQTFLQGSANDARQAARLTAALAAAGDARLEAYLDLFFTKDGPRASPITKALRDKAPALAAAIDREALRLPPLLERRKALALRERTMALIAIGSAVADHYRREKDRRGLLDYDDLIAKTLAMLDRVPGSWVHYKLDRGIDHVLIDEAQDTSPQQWEIVKRLVSEFHAGEGARDGITRTLFAVGDEKQSIFSFQGAVMKEFDEQRRFFRTEFKAAALEWDDVEFEYSFRSGGGILSAVMDTFRSAAVFESVTSDKDGLPAHIALPDAAPSTVELWDLEEASEKQDVTGWRAPFDAVDKTSPQVRLARRIAGRVKAMIGHDTMRHRGETRALAPGDILVLVRRRGLLFDAVIQALKQAHVDVAGADRLKLAEHIAVIDLMALADALLLAQDDLALAVTLKSPLFGLNDDHLMALAPTRGARTLRDMLRDSPEGDMQAAWRRLQACEARASGTPFAFFSWVLGGDGGRARMLKRLGPEANDALDEFLELALAYEKREAATLQGFMHWLRAADIEIKRDMDVARAEVRVMTVHGAKGLEAPVVILADTTMPPAARDQLIRLPLGKAVAGALPCVVWAGRKADDPQALQTARVTAENEVTDEYRRLLYVAMTRAAERLIVCGHMPGNVKEVKPTSWYGLIRDGLETSKLAQEPIDGGRRFRKAGETPLPQHDAAAPGVAPWPQEPAWLRQRVAPDTAPRVLRPSDADVSPAAGTAFSGEGGDARRCGVIVHRLLQSLPDIAPDRRAVAAQRFLARNVADWPSAVRDDLAQRTLGLIDQFGALFGPDSRAEVPMVGRLTMANGERVGISGQIDRLVVSERDVLIADFKTNRTVPQHESEVPRTYRRQLALYRALLAKLYPQHAIRAALIWTETPEMMELSQEALDAELARITSP